MKVDKVRTSQLCAVRGVHTPFPFSGGYHTAHGAWSQEAKFLGKLVVKIQLLTAHGAVSSQEQPLACSVSELTWREN